MKIKKLIIIFLLLIILFYIIIKLYIKDKKKIILQSDKWIVIAVFKSPTLTFINALKIFYSWKIIIISCAKSYENKWTNFNYSDNILYFSINEQKKLEYDIIKNYNLNSYSRKNIGYLYAIQHGAKEIYEIDEDIIISDLYLLNKKYNNTNLCYGNNNYS